MTSTTDTPTGFDAIGLPIPFERRQAAYEAIRNDMAPGVSVEDAMSLVNRVADRLERDQPYEAIREATEAPVGPAPPRGSVDLEAGAMVIEPPTSTPRMEAALRLDYTGAIRLLAHLLA